MHSASHAQGGPALPHSQKGCLPALLPGGSEARAVSKTEAMCRQRYKCFSAQNTGLVSEDPRFDPNSAINCCVILAETLSPSGPRCLYQ